ncbi:TraB/VirB10 family protein [Marinobacter sp. SS13-12]|uniref:TraB/VirB10 family protein n=1 Tax=Marinobacter sp. SS13-12 TaxID=3050451 RepID=UPI002553BAA0|nr:TraB/VirB10 family protein [Marinobacter sp. SS13-12]MDK8465873.1 TraB/VirB10 family protein [Marinobacter sp. SS13-12]
MTAWWSGLSAEDKLKCRKYGIAGGLIMMLLFVYYASGQEVEVVKETKTTDLSLGSDLLEDDIRAKVDRDLKQVGETQREMDSRLRQYESVLAALESSQNTLREQGDRAREDELINPLADLEAPAAGEVSYPEPPSYVPGYTGTDQSLNNIPVEPRVIGGIGRAPGAEFQAQTRAKKKNSIYMPPSHMPAILLTGIRALTSELGDANPEPVMLRVQAPAVLPNSVKANLKGCFVIANATANLAQERVNLQLVSLSCMSLDGTAVIDQPVKGFVADSDGVRGLTGPVVSKMGAHLMRTIVAGLFEGAGAGISSAAATTSTSALGTTQIVDTDSIVQSAGGQALKSGSQAVQKLFLDLAKQTVPIIEVGAAKRLTVVIQKGTDLDIMEKG